MIQWINLYSEKEEKTLGIFSLKHVISNHFFLHKTSRKLVLFLYKIKIANIKAIPLFLNFRPWETLWIFVDNIFWLKFLCVKKNGIASLKCIYHCTVQRVNGSELKGVNKLIGIILKAHLIFWRRKKILPFVTFSFFVTKKLLVLKKYFLPKLILNMRWLAPNHKVFLFHQ